MSERRTLRFLALAMSAGVAAGIVVLWINGVTQRDDKEAAQSELTGLAEQVQAACLRDPVTARKILGEDACGKSKEIVERPPAEKGETGAQGPRGPQGPAGPQGAQGPRGPAGPAGQSPGCLILITKCQGPPGVMGPPGEQGKTGAVGAVGDQGPKGETGDQGPQGDQGIEGPTGPQGPEGPQGPTGPAGPSCEPGSTLQKLQVITTEAPTGTWILACILDDQNP